MTINDITFQVNESIYIMVTGLDLKGRKWQKITKVENEVSLSSFFRDNEALDGYRKGFRRDKLLEPWDDVCMMIMKYLALEGRHSVYYFYHFPLLNHFCNREFVCIPFFLMHALEETMMDVREKKKKGANFTILHQGLMFYLFQFHLALFPPHVIAIDNILPSGGGLHLEFIGGSYAPTPQPSPSQTPVKDRKNKTLTLESTPNKKIKMDKRVEVEIGDSDEETCGNKRRSGRISKTYGRSSFSQEEEEEETNSGESDKNSEEGLEKGKEETDKEVEKWDNTLDGTWDFEVDNPSKDPSPDLTHVSATITLPSIVNQETPKMVNASPDTISSLVRKDDLVNLKG